MYKILVVSVCLAVLTVYSSAARATVPHLIPVVGMVEDSDDVPLDGAYDVVFSLYDGESELAAVWSESYTDVDALEFEDGLFRAYLGTQNSLDTYINHFLDNDELWLGMKIGTDVEMTRVRLAAVPWGIEAEHCGRIGDYEADDLQPAIGETACSGNEFLQGWHPSTGAVCSQMSVPAEYLTEAEGNAAYVQLPTSDLSTCEFGLAWNGTSGELDCMDEADVESRCYTSHGDDAYLGSDGACHEAPHACAANEYLDGNGNCRNGPQVCTGDQYLDGNGQCNTLSGTANRLPLFTPDGQSLGNSAAYQASGGIAIDNNGITDGAQLKLTGTDSNAGVNAQGYKLHINSYDNDDANYTYPIMVEDENSIAGNNPDFWLRSRATAGGPSAAYFQGNVGIGETDPQKPLDVTGEAEVDDLTVNNGLPISFSDVISHSQSNGGNPEEVDLGSTDRRICFLAGMRVHDDMENESEASCFVKYSGGRWILETDVDNGSGDPDVTCHARCFTF